MARRDDLVSCSSPLLVLDGQEKLELWRQLVLRVETVREVNPSDTTVCVNLHAERLDVVCTVGAAGEV